MAANTSPIFQLTPQAPPVNVGTANTARDGTGTITTILTPTTNGTRVDWVRLQATVTTTAGIFRLWIKNGATWFLHAEILMTAITVSGTVQAWSYDYIPARPLVLPSGALLGGSVHNAENVVATAFAGDY